jgi:hypothetical protein
MHSGGSTTFLSKVSGCYVLMCNIHGLLEAKMALFASYSKTGKRPGSGRKVINELD